MPSAARADGLVVQLGFGTQTSQTAYVGGAASTLTGPLAKLSWGGVTVGTSGLSYRAGGLELTLDSVTFDYEVSPDLQLQIGVRSNAAPYSASSHALLSGLTRASWHEVQLGMSYQIDGDTSVDVQWGRDATGRVNGSELTMTTTARRKVGPLPVEARFGLNWKSADLAMYEYGVAPGEAILGRPAYSPGAALTPFVSFETGVPLSENALIFSRLRVDGLAPNVTDSPIVARGLVGSLAFGIGYQF